MRMRGFTFTEIVVVLGILFVVMGIAIYKFKSDSRDQARQLSKVDKQASIRRFLMWFRQDMQSMDEIIQFQVLNSFQADLDSRVVEIKFDRFIDEFDKQVISYKYDYNRGKIYRISDAKSNLGNKQQYGLSLDNVLNFQMIPFNYEGQRISDLSTMKDNLYYFMALLKFSDHKGQESPNSIRPFKVKIYPKLKSSANKAGFNSFYINRRFD